MTPLARLLLIADRLAWLLIGTLLGFMLALALSVLLGAAVEGLAL